MADSPRANCRTSGMSPQQGRCPPAMIHGRAARCAAAALRSASSQARYSPLRPKRPAGKLDASPCERGEPPCQQVIRAGLMAKRIGRR